MTIQMMAKAEFDSLENYLSERVHGSNIESCDDAALDVLSSTRCDWYHVRSRGGKLT